MAKDLFTGEEIETGPIKEHDFDLFKRHGIDPYAQESKPSRHNIAKEFLEGAANVGNTFRLPELGGGILQGAISGARSIANVPLGIASYASGHDVTLPNVDLSQYLRQDPGSRAAFLGGNIAGSIAPGAGAYNALRGAMGGAGVARQVAAGAGAGLALSENDEDPYSRIKGAAIGAAIPAALRGASILRNNPKPQEAYDIIRNSYDQKLQGARDKFTHVTKVAEENFAGQPIPFDNDIIFKALEHGAPTRAFKNVVADAASGDYEALRKLESQLGKRSRDLRIGKNADIDKAALIEETRDDIKNALAEFFKSKNRPDLADTLHAARNEYANLKRVYEYNAPMRNLVAAPHKYPSTFTQLETVSDDTKRLFAQHPELQELLHKRAQSQQIREALSKMAKPAAKAVGAGGTTYGGYELLKHFGIL